MVTCWNSPLITNIVVMKNKKTNTHEKFISGEILESGGWHLILIVVAFVWLWAGLGSVLGSSPELEELAVFLTALLGVMIIYSFILTKPNSPPHFLILLIGFFFSTLFVLFGLLAFYNWNVAESSDIISDGNRLIICSSLLLAMLMTLIKAFMKFKKQ